MWLINPHGRRVNVPSLFAEYYLGLEGWRHAEQEPTHITMNHDISYPIHVGGGSYELSDGTRIRGKANAIEAQSLL